MIKVYVLYNIVQYFPPPELFHIMYCYNLDFLGRYIMNLKLKIMQFFFLQY